MDEIRALELKARQVERALQLQRHHHAAIAKNAQVLRRDVEVWRAALRVKLHSACSSTGFGSGREVMIERPTLGACSCPGIAARSLSHRLETIRPLRDALTKTEQALMVADERLLASGYEIGVHTERATFLQQLITQAQSKQRSTAESELQEELATCAHTVAPRLDEVSSSLDGDDAFGSPTRLTDWVNAPPLLRASSSMLSRQQVDAAEISANERYCSGGSEDSGLVTTCARMEAASMTEGLAVRCETSHAGSIGVRVTETICRSVAVSIEVGDSDFLSRIMRERERLVRRIQAQGMFPSEIRFCVGNNRGESGLVGLRYSRPKRGGSDECVIP